MMKHYFFKLLYFTTFSIGFYLLALIIWANIPYSYTGANFLYRQGAYGHLNTRVKEIPDYGKVDILFVGSSRVYRGFDPRIFEQYGYKVFVLGSSGQGPIQSYILLKRYLEVLNPKLIVFDVLPSTFVHIGVETSLDLIANDKIDKLNWKLAFKQNDLMVWNTLIYAFFRQLVGLHEKFTEPVEKPRDQDTYISGGYIQKELRYFEQINCDLFGKQKWNPPLEMQIAYFKKSIDLCKEINAELLFVNLPIAHYECFENNSELFSQLGLNNIIDFNTLLEFNDSLHYYDKFHLNEKGVLKLNEYFIHKILGSTTAD